MLAEKIVYHEKAPILCCIYVAGILGYPQPCGGTHPPIPSEGVLGEVLGDGAESTLAQGLKNTRFRVVRAAGA